MRMSLRWLQKVSLGLAMGLFACALAQAASAESIERFTVQAKLTPERQLTIEETIDYNFEGTPRHGLLRTLPERYRRSFLRYDLHYTVEAVTMDGRAVSWQEENQGADLVLRIGSQSTYVTGTHRYMIRYRTDRAINDFSDSHELYWNVTGNEWPVPINRASFSFSGVEVQRQSCFTGSIGSTDTACSFRKASGSGALVADSPSRLEAHEGFTVVLEFPKGSLAARALTTDLWYGLRDNLFTLFPLLLCFVMVWIWYVWGRDPRGRGVIIPQYEPPDNLTPGLVAGLVEEEISTKAMSATILDLARRGHATLELVGADPEKPEHVFYTKTSTPPSDVLAPYEAELLTALFVGQTRVDLGQPSSQSQWAAYQKIIKTLTDDMIARGWFLKNPGAVRGSWLGLAFFIVVFAFVFESPLYIVLAVVVGLLGWQMPKMTPLAAEVYERILGFKRFLTVTEKDRLAFSDAPAKRPEKFAEFLPAAVALGVEKEWAKQFEGMRIAPPAYIQGAGMHWGSLAYIHALGPVSHSVATAMTRQTQGGSGGSGFSGGGGSSGGGFGGGGGGSW